MALGFDPTDAGLLRRVLNLGPCRAVMPRFLAKIGTWHDATQIVALVILRDPTRFHVDRPSEWYLSGLTSHALRGEWNRDYKLAEAAGRSTSLRRCAVATPAYQTDPFELIEEKDRDIVREYYYSGPSVTANKFNTIRQSVYKRVKSAVEAARA